MPPSTKPSRAKSLRGWSLLITISVILGWILTALHFPAGVLLACLLSGIFLSSRKTRLGVPPIFFSLAQGVLGCLMAKRLQPATLARVAGDWPIFLGAAISIIAASAGLGWLLMRRQVFPGTTALWGLAPGAASAMVVLAEAYGADMRLVAFMQYLRVAVVTVLAALVAHFWTSQVGPVATPTPWLDVTSAYNMICTLVLAFGVSSLGSWLRIPGGAMVLPLFLAATLQQMGFLVIELSPVLLALSYAVIGWSIGLRFTTALLQHAWRALPMVLASIFALIGVGLLTAVVLNQLAGHDALTSYLASSPGGIDSVAIIAATSAADAGFVMAMQITRFLMILLFGPRLSKFIAARNP